MNVLYVGSDKYDKELMCPGSMICLALAEQIPEDSISVQNCDILRRTDNISFPDWLNGTPIFINEDEGIPYRGRDAVNQLKRVLSNVLQKNKTSREPIQMSMNQQMQPTIRQQTKPSMDQPTSATETDSLEDHFKMDVVVQEDEPRSGKITEQDLQKYMELRNNSPASAQPPQNQTNSQ
jgi:hypothetical protein